MLFLVNSVFNTRHDHICVFPQNQDLTVIEDYITGLKALLYLHERDDLHDAGWHYQVLFSVVLMRGVFLQGSL